MNRPARRPGRSAPAATLALLATLLPGVARASLTGREQAVPPPRALRVHALWDRDAMEAAGIRSPERLLYGPDGTLYVLDGESRRIVALDPAGRPIRSVGGYGSDEASLEVPVDLILDHRGSLLVLDRSRGEIVAFDPAGRFLTSRTLAGDALDEGRTPGVRLLRDPFGSLWLLAPSARDLIPLDDQLAPARVSRYLEPRDSLVTPTLAAFAPGGDVWVYDAGPHALRRFGSGGRLLLRASLGDSTSVAVEPAEIASDRSGAAYVADPAGQRILVVAPSGTVTLTRFLGGAERPWRPTSLAVGPGDLLAAADADRDEIQVFSVGREEGGP
jgi:DNA-binding beta-propeller fold protein YncE